MKRLVRELIPHAPHLGLYVSPDIPSDKVGNARKDYGERVAASDVLVLYDATLLGSAKDGALFTAGRMVFQNNDLEPIHEIRYQDVVGVEPKRKLIGGRRIVISVNQGRATFNVELDFSGKPGAADYVLRFLREAMLHEEVDVEPGDGVTDEAAVREALDRLHDRGLLSTADRNAMLGALRRS